MQIKIKDGKIKSSSLFKLTALGYALGAGALFIPLFLLMTLLTIAAISAGMPANVNGAPVTGGLALVAGVMPLIILPFALAVQAIIFGALITLGLWLYTRKRTIQIIEE